MAKHSRSPSESRGTKRPRVAAKPPPSALTATPSSWAELTYGLAGVIAEHALANDVSDYMSFRAVCREWRRGTEDDAPRAKGCLDRRFHPRRWIMLREAAPPERHRRRFLNVSTGQCVQTELPELDGHHLLGATTEGLLALLDVATHVVRVLNPITRQLLDLPPLDPLLSEEMRRIMISGPGLDVSGMGLADDSTVALCLWSLLVVAKPGDASWTRVEANAAFRFNSAMSFSGRFYCATSSAVMALEVGAAHEPPRLELVAEITFRTMPMDTPTVHLVESDGKLLLLRGWSSPWKGLYSDRKFQVYRVHLGGARDIVAVRGLGGRALFVGKIRALCVPAGVFPSIRSNTVYLGYDLLERIRGTVAYNLHDRKVTERCDRRGGVWAWARPCGIAEYLSWYVSSTSRKIEEI